MKMGEISANKFELYKNGSLIGVSCDFLGNSDWNEGFPNIVGPE